MRIKYDVIVTFKVIDGVLITIKTHFWLQLAKLYKDGFDDSAMLF